MAKPPLPSSRRGASGLNRLLQAIVKDDRRAVGQLLKKEPWLSTTNMDKAVLYQSTIVHWLYAGDTALHLAAAGHRVEITRMLLDAGADPDAAGNHRLSRPLHYAADGAVQNPAFEAADQVKTLRLLLAAGADLHAQDKNGATALHRAVRTRAAAAVTFLLKAGADPTAKNHPGATAFHLAVQNTGKSGSGHELAKAGQKAIIKTMLAHGVSPDLRDARGKSVRDWATSDGIRQLLM
jgi:ankyrin repeat protein